MAIDTAEKRNSAMQILGEMPWTPDGTIGVLDRLVMLEFYSGWPAADGTPNYLHGGLFGRSMLCGKLIGSSVLGGELFGREQLSLGGRLEAN